MHAIAPAEVRAALDALLASRLFAQAHRMCLLMRFLVERHIGDATAHCKEYVIGLEVFNRNPALYSTAEDPIVRVQVSRLRERLRLYYIDEGRCARLVFSIPLGTYVPHIQRAGDAAPDAGPAPDVLLALATVRPLAGGRAAARFAQGLEAELADGLFGVFGSRVAMPAAVRCNGPVYRLDTCVRIEGRQVRTSFRLVDGASRLRWSQQVDRHGAVGMAMQRQVAQAACLALGGVFTAHLCTVADSL